MVKSCKRRNKFLVFFLIFMGLFCSLGIWQLHRYHDKKLLMTEYESRIAEVPQSFKEIAKQSGDVQFRNIFVDGQYVNNLTMIIQNRFYKEQLGYEVITPMRIPFSDKLLLVDRGWFAQTDQHVIPNMVPVTEPQHISGYIKYVNEYQFILGNNIQKTTPHLMLIQKLDIPELSRFTQQSFYPFIVRLNANSQNGFTRDWIVVAVPPARHLGYAIQWFIMAFVLLIASICYCCEKKES